VVIDNLFLSLSPNNIQHILRHLNACSINLPDSRDTSYFELACSLTHIHSLSFSPSLPNKSVTLRFLNVLMHSQFEGQQERIRPDRDANEEYNGLSIKKEVEFSRRTGGSDRAVSFSRFHNRQ